MLINHVLHAQINHSYFIFYKPKKYVPLNKQTNQNKLLCHT